jgi:putative copper export protein
VQAHRLSTGSTTSALGTGLTETGYGPGWIAREVLIGGLLAVALTLRRREPALPLTALTLIAVLSLCAALALNSHSASARGHVSLATFALGLHLLRPPSGLEASARSLWS